MANDDNGQPITRAVEVERWRGRVDVKLQNLKEDAEKAVNATAEIAKDVKSLQQSVTKLVVASGIVAFLGSAVVSLIIGLLIKTFAR